MTFFWWVVILWHTYTINVEPSTERTPYQIAIFLFQFTLLCIRSLFRHQQQRDHVVINHKDFISNDDSYGTERWENISIFPCHGRRASVNCFSANCHKWKMPMYWGYSPTNRQILKIVYWLDFIVLRLELNKFSLVYNHFCCMFVRILRLDLFCIPHFHFLSVLCSSYCCCHCQCSQIVPVHMISGFLPVCDAHSCPTVFAVWQQKENSLSDMVVWLLRHLFVHGRFFPPKVSYEQLVLCRRRTDLWGELFCETLLSLTSGKIKPVITLWIDDGRPHHFIQWSLSQHWQILIHHMLRRRLGIWFT
jgi:hypothetical protein